MVNGYVTLDLASKNIYKEALGAIKAQKPVMVVDLPNVYFADTIKATTINDEPVVQITKGGKTITINDVNAVSSEGDIQKKKKHFHNICIINPEANSYPSVLNFVLVNERSTKYTTFNEIQTYFKDNINDVVYGANGLYFNAKTGEITNTKANVYVKYDSERLANYVMNLTTRAITREQLYNQQLVVNDYVVEL